MCTEAEQGDPRPIQVPWTWVTVGITAYVALGQVVQFIPNPMVPHAILALNMVVPVLVGYTSGPLAGALTGALGTLLNFGLKIPLWGADPYEIAAVIPHAVMGAAAGSMPWRQNRISAGTALLIGHGLNILVYLLLGLLPPATLGDPNFWTGLIAEATVGIIAVALCLNVFHRFQERYWLPRRDHMRGRDLLLIGGGIGLLTLFLGIEYLGGVQVAAYLFIVPVVLTALQLSAMESWLVALSLSLLLGLTVIREGLAQASHEVALILLLNLVAMAVGELAENVREQRRLAEGRLKELEHVYAELAATDQFKAEIIQNVSHELRTPLAILMGYADLLASEGLGTLTEEQKKAAEGMRRSVRQLTWLVEQVTVLTHVEEGNLAWQLAQPVEVVHQQVENLREWASSRGCPLSLAVQGEIPELELDVDYIGRAIRALLDNAVKFSPQGGPVEVSVWSEGERVCLAVRDHGIGIAPEKQPHLFERFYQVNGSTTRHFGGMGIGLALVRDVVQAHGGQVWVESAPGAGSTIGFWLPVTDRRSPSRQTAPQKTVLLPQR